MIRILCARSGFLGDVVVSTNALPHIKKHCLDSEVHFTTWSACAPLLELNPHIDRITKPGRVFASEYSHRVDFRHEAERPRFKGDDDPMMYWGEVHARQAADACGFILYEQEHLADICGLSTGVPMIRPELYIGSKDMLNMSEYRPCVVINVWSQNGVNWRLWATEKWVELVKELQKMDYVVVQLGGKGDPQIDGVNIQLCGKTSLRETISVVASADLVIGIDSFTMHIAHSNKFCDGVKLGGPTRSILLCGPVPAQCVVPPNSPCSVVSNFPDCDGPCNHSFATPELPICAFGNSCMKNLPIEKVMEKIDV